MKFTRKTLIVALAALIAASGSYVLGSNGAMASVAQAVTESRCDSGAFIHHSTDAGAVAADSQPTDIVTPQSGPQGSLLHGANAQVLGDNLIPNPGVDSGLESAPTSWYHNIYATNQAVFTRVSGDNSNGAVRTTISNYTNGDAAWYYKPLSVQPGGYYRYTDDYRSNDSTRAVLELDDTSGHIQYIDLTSTGPSSTWAKYQTTFFVPNNVTQAMVFHPLAANGYLDLDNFSLTQVQPQGFTSPIVTLTFDDGWRSTHDNALPLLKAAGIVTTQYIISGYLGQAKAYMTPADVYDFKKSGSEIGSHTVDHPDLTKQSPAVLTAELKRSQQNLGKCFGTPVDFATPYGTFNATTTAQIQKYYQTDRSTDSGFNTIDNFNPYGLLVQNVTVGTTQAQINSWLATARQNHAWLILVYHQVDNSGSEFSRHPADLKNDLQAIKASGIAVKTMQQAYAEVAPQVAAKN